MKNEYLNLLEQKYLKAKNPMNAIPMEKYMKNKFKHLGIKSPERKLIYKDFFTKNGLPSHSDVEAIIKELWDQPFREYQYFAIELLSKLIKKAKPEIISLLEFITINKSWWDTVDGISSNLVGTLFNIYPEMILENTNRWMNSGNIWLQRTCILFQLKYKIQTNFELLSLFIIQISDSNEFFIQKAIGWALREYGKTNPNAVISFTNKHHLAPLSKREALRIIRKSM